MASEDYKESEISKIVKRLMDEEGFEFGEAVREAMEQTKNFESKANGGSIGIEVLFGPKRENFIYGGTVNPDGRRGFFKGAQADTKKGKAMSPGTTASGGFKGGNNNNNNNNPPPVIIPKDNTPKPITFNDVTGKKMLPADLAIQKQFLNLVKKKGYESGLDTEADDLYEAYRKATGLDNFNQNVLLDSTTNILDKEKDGILKTFVDRNTTIKDLDTGKSTKQLMLETPTGLIQRTVRPSGIMENDIPQPFGAPQSLSVDPMKMAELNDMQKKMLGGPQKNLKDIMGITNEEILENIKPFNDPDAPATIEDVNKFYAADGGRVGFFMGGPALEGQALAIYNSMNTYGATDQEIADRLGSMGLYDPNASTPDPTPDPGQGGSQSGGRGSDQDVGYVDRQDYSFNKKNYGPGKQLEINPAAFGMSFPDQPKGPKQEGIIGQIKDTFTTLPTRSLSSFASPTTGGNIIGPAEQGFMEQTLDIDPAGRTREEIRSLYDNYNRFLGRQSNFADARQKGKAGDLINAIPYIGNIKRGVEAIFGPRGDKSLQSKYTVDGVGFGSTGARDEFGLATFDKKDGFLGLTGNTTRNYTDRMQEKVGDLTSFFERTFKERGLGDFDIDDLDIDNMKSINSTYAKQLQAYKQRLAVEDINKRTRDTIESQRIQRELAAAAAAKNKAAALAAIKKQGQADYNPNIHGPTNYGQDSQGNQSFDSGQGFGIGSDGGPVSNRTGRGRTGFSEGGLATMFTRRR